jgi:hypothetical protein
MKGKEKRSKEHKELCDYDYEYLCLNMSTFHANDLEDGVYHDPSSLQAGEVGRRQH